VYDGPSDRVVELEANIWCRRYQEYFNDIRSLGLDEFGEEFAEHINSNDSDYVMKRIRDEWIAGTSCTVVLIGKCTWARRYIDWEIAATLRDFEDSDRGGLIAVQLPAAADHGWSKLPPRLEKNVIRENGVDVGYARFYPPAPSDDTISKWVDAAVARRDALEPASGSTSDLMLNNRNCD
jgi:hypothetical protein